MNCKYIIMSFLFGSPTNTKESQFSTPTEAIDLYAISINRLKKNKNLEDGYYHVRTKHGEYLGNIRNKMLHGQGKYTFNDGRYQEGVFDEGVFVSGSSKMGKETLTGSFSEFVPEILDCKEGTIDFGNGITFSGSVRNNYPVKGEYTVSPNTPIEFIGWRGIKSGNMGVLTRDDNNMWVQTYKTGSVREIRSSGLNPRKMTTTCGSIRITFTDGSVYKGNQSHELSDNNDDVFMESSNIATQFKDFNNYELDYWLVANRNLDHFPDKFFINIRDCNVTGTQLLEFNDECLEQLGLFSLVFRTQLKCILSRFKV